MFGKYTPLIKQNLKCESAHKVFQKLIEEELYDYKTLKAYIIIDNAYKKSTDRRQLKWAKGYLKNHSIKFRDIQAHVDAAWKEDAKIYADVYSAFSEAYPGLEQFFEHYL